MKATDVVVTAVLAATAVYLVVGGDPERRLAALRLPRAGQGSSRFGCARAQLWALRRLVEKRARGGRQGRLRAVEVVELCGALSAELRSGRPPPEALGAAARSMDDGDGDVLIAVLRSSDAPGADVPLLLRAAADVPGAGGLRMLGACWHVAADSGAGLADAVDRLADGFRAEAQLRREVEVQLAGPRATARLLAGLPLGGVLLGRGLGGDPLHVLLSTPLGRACLLCGSALTAAGWLWTGRLARRAGPVS